MTKPFLLIRCLQPGVEDGNTEIRRQDGGSQAADHFERLSGRIDLPFEG